jgi:hypothetical protein
VKGYDAGFPKKPKFSINFAFEKFFSGVSLCMGDDAGIRAMHIFSSTYFNDISIFGLSKDQSFRI